MKTNKNETFPLLVSIPHSGVQIPPEADWLKGIEPSVLMCDVDAYVDELYNSVLKEFKIPTIVFKWIRYAVDVNRFSIDISDETVEGGNELAGKSPSDVHWHKTTKGDTLIQEPLSQELHKNLIAKYFDSFHDQIQTQIEEFKSLGNNRIYLLDLHSMPSRGSDFHRDPGANRPQVVVSDVGGQSCSRTFRDLVLNAYQTAGFETALNWPYKGGAITQQYGHPQSGQEALQVELNRKLYMDEETKDKNSDYKEIQKLLKKAITYIMENKNRLG